MILFNPYEQAVKEVIVKFEYLIQEYKDRGCYSPIERVEGRVKSISSILAKCRKKGILSEFPEEWSDCEALLKGNILSEKVLTDKIEDIAGVRIICPFVEDIARVVQFIHGRRDMEVKTVKDYISDVKESGYRSYHMIVWYTVETIDGPKKIKIEIQIRTLAMDFWATIEHSLQYKCEMQVPQKINERFMHIADATVLLDQEMSRVRSDMIEAGKKGEFPQTLI